MDNFEQHARVIECPKPEMFIDHKNEKVMWDITDTLQYVWEHGTTEPYTIYDLYDPTKEENEENDD